MIEIDRFSFTYRNALRPSLQEVDLAIEDGEFVLLAGPSGCGKSTLCLGLNGIVPHLVDGEMTGSVRIDGKETRNFPVHELAADVGLVFQNPDNQLFSLTVEEDVAFGLENQSVPPGEMARRVDAALSLTGMEACRGREVACLSGGQKQRTAIAGVLAMNPRTLVFDEPTADLDPEGAAGVLATIRALNKDEGRTVVVVEHRVREVLPHADRVVCMKDGRVTRDVDASSVTPQDLGWGYRPRRRHPPPPVRREAVRFSGVHYRYPDGTGALRGVDLTVGAGEFVAVVGENGSGKSTLAMHINGLLRASAGSVAVLGRDVGAMKPREVAPGVGFLFQNPNHQIFSDCVSREVALGLEGRRYSPDERDHRVREALAAGDLTDFEDRDPNTLSRGERQRLAAASVLATDPAVYVLDEPTTGQDHEHIMQMMDFIEGLNREGRTVVLITHDHDLARAYADRIVVMEGGRVADEVVP
ncbi:ABC transporter ATP-binding protein [Methanofollis formosanus]|uniref:ABC transporter ATP-binding protein n=1 Tax=Methanofollis formosanus TaxID=299308 RepID=A0A8G1A4Y5_9EURY|nr:ABC transporter ATP-binding protein [Methanofollis formosanus]QYZ80172.1 ABC transporter ATP-binding protein [Methanofollis formosanus]